MLIRTSTLVALAALSSTAFVRASDDREITLGITPGRGHWVASGTPIRIAIAGLTPDKLAMLDRQSLRFTLNGIDVTAALVAEALRQNAVTWEADGHRLVLEVATLLAPGHYTIGGAFAYVTGTKRSFATDFTVYDPAVVRTALGPVPLAGGPGFIVDATPPVVALAPEDQEFLSIAKPNFAVTFADRGAGVANQNVKVLFDNVDVTAQCTFATGSASWTPATPLGNGAHTLVAQVKDLANNLTVRSATVIVFTGARRPWPFAPTTSAHPLGHLHEQYQQYGSGTNGAYFHHGLDIREPSGTSGYACRGGRVTNCNWYDTQPLYFEIEITDADGYRWQYHHVDNTTVPQAIFTAYQTNGSIADGTLLGKIVPWPVSAYGQVYNHWHLNVLAPDGRYMNPLNFLIEPVDNVPPTVKNVWVATQGTTTALNNGTTGATVAGNLDVIAECEDLMPGQPYQLCIYKTTLEITQIAGPGSHNLPETTFWRFNFLPGGGDRYLNVFDIFKYQLSTPTGTKTTMGNYTSRVFLYNVTNKYGGTLGDAVGYWPTTAKDAVGGRLWPNGTYRLTVRAYDYEKNVGSRSIDVVLANP